MSRKKRDPLIDLDELAPAILDPIRRFVDDYRGRASFERWVQLFGVQFTIHRRPLIRESELKAVFQRHSELATASAQTLREQAAEIEAESGFALAKGRADSLKERLTCAVQAEVEAVRKLNEARAEIIALKLRVVAFTTEKDALREQLRELDKQRGVADQRVQELVQERAALMAARRASDAKCADLQSRLDEAAETTKRIGAREKQAFGENIALRGQMNNLRAEQERLKAKNAALEAESTKFAVGNQVLENVHSSLQEWLRHQRKALRAQSENANTVNGEAHGA